MSEVAAPAAQPAAPVAPAPSAAPAESGPAPAQNPADKASAAPADAKPATTTDDRPEAQGKHRAERKISRLYREAAEQKARAEFFEKKFNETQKPAPTAGSPTLAQFDYDPEKYAEAKAEYVKTQAFKDQETKQRTESARQEHQRLSAAWEEKVERGADKYEDFDEKVGRLQPGTAFTDAIIECENAEDVAYYFGDNPAEAHRILKLHPRAQIREIGKIEAKLLATPPQAKQPSKAPAPIVPLSGNSTAESFSVSDTKDVGKWIKNRQKQVHGARR